MAAVVADGVLWFAMRRIPQANTYRQHFDTLIVLGVPARLDGTPSPEMREHVDEAVRAFHDGDAGHIILTGGAAHNRFVEAGVMARYAQQRGVPQESLIVEEQARNTLENLWFSRKLMEAHGWHSAEVVSARPHLCRASLILQRYRDSNSLQWRMRPSRVPPEFGPVHRFVRWQREVVGCLLMWFHWFDRSRYLPR